MTADEMQDQYDRLMRACVAAGTGFPSSHRRVYTTTGGTGFNVEDGTIRGPESDDAVRLHAALLAQGFTFTTEAVDGWYGTRPT